MQGELTADGEIVIYADRWKVLLVLIGAIAFVILGLELIRMPDIWLAERLELLVVGAAAILFFGAAAAYCAYRLLIWRPVVVIGPRGITDRASLLGVGFLPWSNVAYVAPYKYRSQAVLGVFPLNLNIVLEPLSWWHRLAIRANGRLGCAPVNIPQVVLPGTTDDLARLIASRFSVQVRLDA